MMIKFLKRWKREIIRKKISKLNVRSAKYQKKSEAEMNYANTLKPTLDSYAGITGTESFAMSVSKEYIKSLVNSAKYQAKYTNCQKRIDELNNKALDISIKN